MMKTTDRIALSNPIGKSILDSPIFIFLIFPKIITYGKSKILGMGSC